MLDVAMNNLGGYKKDIHLPDIGVPTNPNSAIIVVIIVIKPSPVPTNIIGDSTSFMLLDSGFQQTNEGDTII